ncbi:MAG: hypothetical protein M1835_001906 [Candelina submexicana]|nr:MAG: hypothetical protein M1835_001906 [Candelina submexicana]
MGQGNTELKKSGHYLSASSVLSIDARPVRLIGSFWSSPLGPVEDVEGFGGPVKAIQGSIDSTEQDCGPEGWTERLLNAHEGIRTHGRAAGGRVANEQPDSERLYSYRERPLEAYHGQDHAKGEAQKDKDDDGVAGNGVLPDDIFEKMTFLGFK